eukprot:TRINITY_DN28623_c0_g1_i1.p1 TRINITY_DN28623_c0_g1~~TRINITY_DN28623_c0_g1_i1.p1  ORF type:complete len:128 (+),score=31.15 TRINITY_DN28623_c0_g1_i1:117-500(+)
MIRRPPRSTQSRSSAASDVYKRQINAEYGISQKQKWRDDTAQRQRTQTPKATRGRVLSTKTSPGAPNPSPIELALGAKSRLSSRGSGVRKGKLIVGRMHPFSICPLVGFQKHSNGAIVDVVGDTTAG